MNKTLALRIHIIFMHCVHVDCDLNVYNKCNGNLLEVSYAL